MGVVAFLVCARIPRLTRYGDESVAFSNEPRCSGGGDIPGQPVTTTTRVPPAAVVVANASVMLSSAACRPIGKTSVALRWAHAAAGNYPDGQLWVNLHGYDESRARHCL